MLRSVLLGCEDRAQDLQDQGRQRMLCCGSGAPGNWRPSIGGGGGGSGCLGSISEGQVGWCVVCVITVAGVCVIEKYSLVLSGEGDSE